MYAASSSFAIAVRADATFSSNAASSVSVVLNSGRAFGANAGRREVELGQRRDLCTEPGQVRDVRRERRDAARFRVRLPRTVLERNTLEHGAGDLHLVIEFREQCVGEWP